MESKLTRQELIEEIKKLKDFEYEFRRREGIRNLYFFNKEILGWPDITETPHKKLCEFIEQNTNKKLLVLMPRGHLKSTVVTVSFSCQQIAKNPNIRILIASDTATMAEAFLKQIKDILGKNESFRELYGDYVSNAPQWSNSMITVGGLKRSYEKKEATITAYGLGGQLVSQHYDIIILDDVVNRDNTNTKELIDKTFSSYKDLLSLLEPQGRLIILGTRWHFADLYGYILDKDNGMLQDFKVLLGKAYYGEFNTGIILWPKKFSWEKLAELKRQQGDYVFNSQYMNTVIDEASADFKRVWFKYYTDYDIKGKILTKFIAIDPAISTERSADYSVILTIGVDEWNNWYILDIDRDRYNPKQLIDKIFYYDEKHHPKSIGIETVAFQKVLQFTINDEMRKKNRFLPFTELPLDSSRSKEDRIRGLQPRYQQGAVFHNKNMPNNDWLEDELTRFPKGPHDDIIDSLAYQLQVAFPPKKHISERQEKKFLY